jgi:hypothetical protein
VRSAEAQELFQPYEVGPERGDGSLFVAWSVGAVSPTLEVDVPDDGAEVEVQFLLDLPSGRVDWSTVLYAMSGTTEFVTPTPVGVDPSLQDVPGMLSALAWHRDAAGVVHGSRSADAVPVTLTAGGLSHRAVTLVRRQLEVAGVLVDFYDRGEVTSVSDGMHQLQTDEVEVDREE